MYNLCNTANTVPRGKLVWNVYIREEKNSKDQ